MQNFIKEILPFIRAILPLLFLRNKAGGKKLKKLQGGKGMKGTKGKKINK